MKYTLYVQLKIKLRVREIIETIKFFANDKTIKPFSAHQTYLRATCARWSLEIPSQQVANDTSFDIDARSFENRDAGNKRGKNEAQQRWKFKTRASSSSQTSSQTRKPKACCSKNRPSYYFRFRDCTYVRTRQSQDDRNDDERESRGEQRRRKRERDD